jgi:hypothetical protein
VQAGGCVGHTGFVCVRQASLHSNGRHIFRLQTVQACVCLLQALVEACVAGDDTCHVQAAEPGHIS